MVVELYDQKINNFPIKDHEDLEDILINAADTLTEGDQKVILEALLNATVDFYVFCIEAGDDIEDIGFLVSEIEDRVCNAVSFRSQLQLVDDELNQDRNEEDVGDPDDEDDGLPTPIEDAPVICSRCSDSDDIRDKDIPGMMKPLPKTPFPLRRGELRQRADNGPTVTGGQTRKKGGQNRKNGGQARKSILMIWVDKESGQCGI